MPHSKTSSSPDPASPSGAPSAAGRENPLEQPFRVGLFSTVQSVDRAIDELHQHGFDHRQISVICSDETKRAHFDAREASHVREDRLGASLGGGMLGATLGGLTAIAGLSTLGGAAVVAAGALSAAMAGGVAGSFAAAMVSRGFEKEPADYFDLAVEKGKILVAVEDRGPQQESRLREAAEILRRSGAEPIALPEG